MTPCAEHNIVRRVLHWRYRYLLAYAFFKDNKLNKNEVYWNWDVGGNFGVRRSCDDVFAEEDREDIKDFSKLG
jgi:hypothetical protein